MSIDIDDVDTAADVHFKVTIESKSKSRGKSKSKRKPIKKCPNKGSEKV